MAVSIEILDKIFAVLVQNFYMCGVTQYVWYLDDYVPFLSFGPRE